MVALADELKIREYRDKFSMRLWRTKAQEDPRIAWQNALLSMNDLKNRRLVFTTIAETWIEKEGLSVLEEISNSTISEYSKASIYEKALGQIAETDIERAVDVAASLGLSHMSFNPTGRVVSNLLSKYAEDKPYQLFGLADSLDERFVSIAKFEALTAIARKSPQEAVAMLAQVDNPAFVRRASATIAALWAREDPKSSFEWYVNSERDKRDPALRVIMRRLVEENAHGAFKIATGYPGELGTLLTNSFFGVLVSQDAVQATEFVSLLDGDKRQVPVTLIGQRLAGSDISRAFELAKSLPESGRKEYRDKIISAALSRDPFYLLENLDQLPGTELQGQVALQLLMRDKTAGLFSENQLKNLRSRLNDHEQQELESVVVSGRYYW